MACRDVCTFVDRLKTAVSNSIISLNKLKYSTLKCRDTWLLVKDGL